MIAENLKSVKNRIAESCTVSKRESDTVTLIAVSKYQPEEKLIDAYNSGQRHFGENRAREFELKSNTLIGDYIWHFIGTLQTNKIKYIIKTADYIHSVDSLRLAEEINRLAAKVGKIQKILLEYKTGGEENKQGIETFEELKVIATEVRTLENVELVGLMTMAPFTDDKAILRNCFVKLRNAKEELNNIGFNLTELSMGMSNDYDIAIEEGATFIRVGTAIFKD